MFDFETYFFLIFSLDDSVKGTPLSGVYSATKHAVEALSDALRREVAHMNISVSIIEPAYVKVNILLVTRDI